MESDYQKLFDFLAIKDEPHKADLIMGFGHFDMNIPKKCCELYIKGFAGKILYTGGVGAGSANFDNPEAIEFLKYTRQHFPQIPEDDIIIEDKSNNTGKNIRYGLDVLKFKLPSFNFNYGMETAILVATPARQQRVYLTARMYLMGKTLYNLPPDSSYQENLSLFQSQNEDFNNQILGEFKRIMEYPEKGFCDFIDIPDDILQAYKNITNQSSL